MNSKRHACTYCEKTFTTTSNRNKHQKLVHLYTLDDIELDSDKVKRARSAKPRTRKPASVCTDPQLKCNYCSKIFSTAQHRRTHEGTIHDSPSYSNPNTAVTCKECSSTFPSLNIYRQHLRQAHAIVINRVEHHFTSEKEFLEWKDRLEMDVGVNYTRHSGPKKGRHGSKQTYFCRRSGVKRLSTQSAQENKRAGRRQGTCKIGQFCTSSIDVLRSDGRIQVTYFVDHHDHDIDVQSLVHMKLPKCDKDKMAAMITLGLSYDKILDHVRETSGMYCASLLEKKDIENIANEFGLKQDTQRHPDDNTSVRLIAQELKDAAELLYYKDQGVMDQEYRNIHEKEFVLGFMTKAQEIIFSNHLKITENIQVCMDSTHSMSQYSGYQLTTLMTVTDLNEGFPVAFLISSTVNTNIVKAFLDKVKNRMGTIRAHIFMSADDPLFRKAWEASMSGETVPFYLNCFWHTDRTFRKSIASKIQAPTTEKAVIYQMLRALMDEPEEDVFQEECKSFLKYLLEAGFNAFHNYFTLNYLDEKRIKLWPKCFHNNVTFHTNNHLENMHRVVKYIYLRGKKAKRLDCTILTLEKMVNDKLYKRIIDLMRNRTVGRYKYHFSECQKQGRDLKVDQREHGVFYVYSASNKNKQYEVKTCGLPCETCRERCPYCHVCKCMYVCSCEDSGEGQKNICKHIHAVIQFRKDKCLPANSKDPTNEIEMIQEEVCINTSSSESLVREWQQKILSKISLNLVPKCKDLKDLQILKSVDDLITKTIAVMDAAARCPASTCKLPVDVDTSKEPSNEAFAKQDRLDSTRKKRKNTDEGTSFVKPSIKAKHMIDDSLLKEDEVRTPVLSKGDVQQEHCYC